MSYTLGDIVTGLPAKGGGRQNWGTTTDTSIGIEAAMQSVQEITESAELEELKAVTVQPPTTPLALTAGNPVVPISTLIASCQANGYFTNDNVTDITDIYTFWVWLTTGYNTAGRALKYRRITTIDSYTFGITSNSPTSYGVAPNVYYSRFGNEITLAPAPDQNYAYFVRVKIRHPWPTANYSLQTIYAPDSWKEIFQYSAILRLAANEGIQDSSIYKTAMDFLTLRGMAPWQIRKLQMHRDELHNERQFSLQTSRYTYARR